MQLIDNPSTPPVNTYSVAVNLTAGSSTRCRSRPVARGERAHAGRRRRDLAPGITRRWRRPSRPRPRWWSSPTTPSPRPPTASSLNLPSAQDELISAVAAANPHTVVVVDAGAPVAMPWLSQVSSVLDAGIPASRTGPRSREVLFGQVDPSGHLPVTFPTSLSRSRPRPRPSSPGPAVRSQYSEGVDVGYRWYDAQHIHAAVPVRVRAVLHAVRVQRPARRTRRGRRRARRPGVGDGHQRRESSRAPMSPSCTWAIRPRRRAAASAGRLPARPAGSRAVDRGCSSRSPRATRGGGTTGPAAGPRPPGLYRVYVGDSSALADLPLRDAFQMTPDAGGSAGARQRAEHDDAGPALERHRDA